MRLPQKVDRRRRIATAAVEFACVAPLLALLLVGLWEVGRMVEVQQMLVNACREGGRQASAAKSSTAVQNAVVNYLKVMGLSNVTTSNVTVTNITHSGVGPDAATQLDQFHISVSIPFSSVRWVLLSQITSVTTLSASADWYSMEDIPITVSSTIPTV